MIQQERVCLGEGGPHLSVGIANADPLHIGAAVDRLASAGVRFLHIDVMDGKFCPPATTAAPSLARALAARFRVDVHLMVDDPQVHVAAWVDAGAHAVTFQLEGARHAHRILQELTGRGVARGVALAPSTSVALAEPLLDEIELLLLLSVNPGWSRQRFLESTFARVREAMELIGERPITLAVDGAITRDGIAERVAASGAGLIVSGSAVFDGDPAANATLLLNQIAAGAATARRR